MLISVGVSAMRRAGPIANSVEVAVGSSQTSCSTRLTSDTADGRGLGVALNETPHFPGNSAAYFWNDMPRRYRSLAT